MKKMMGIIGFDLCMTICQAAIGTTLYVDASVSEPGDGHSWETAFQKIQEGIDAATDGDTVIVAPATYVENIHFHGKNITLTSTDPLDPHVVLNTIIDGNPAAGRDSVVTFDGTEDASCVLSGFTIRNGEAEYGGGIWGRSSRAAIENNTVAANSAEHGGGLYDCQGVIRRNTISGNSAGWYGGGLSYCHGVIESNTISGNSAGQDGGGLAYCNGAIHHNTITGNSAGQDGGGLSQCEDTSQNNVVSANSARRYGGGLARCGGTIRNNTVSSNWARTGGGLQSCAGTIENNVISGNSVEKTGGGISACAGRTENNAIIANSAGLAGGGLIWSRGAFRNNTICGNWAGGYGGGLAACVDPPRNCIIWANSAPSYPQLYRCSLLTYSCIQDWTGGGEGNIAQDPRFVSAENGDFRLCASSPCIDAGENFLLGFYGTDIAGMHRIMYGGKSFTVDMGAYEYYINQVQMGPAPDATTLTWSSLPYRTYSVFYSHDLLTWHLADGNVPSADVETTSWTDDGFLTGIPPLLVPRRFYRILENP